MFPFAFAHTPEGIAVGLSPICGSVRLGLGIPAGEREEDLREPLAQITPELRAAIRGMLAKILGWDRAALRSLPPAPPDELFRLEVREPRILLQILQNTLFSKLSSSPFELTTAHNMLIGLYLLTLIMQAAADGPMSELMWRELGSLGVHDLLKDVLHEGEPEGFKTLFASSEFGQWALAA